MSFRILHLSDVHFGRENHYGRKHDPQQQAIDLLEDLHACLLSYSIAPRFDAVVLSGDFTWGGDDQGFEVAERFIYFFKKQKMCLPDRMYVVPGNHDIAWNSQSGELRYDRYQIRRRYIDFATRVMEDSPEDNEWMAILAVFDISRVTLIGLNSSRIESTQARGIGYVGFDQVYSLTEAGWQKNGRDAFGGDLRIAFLHHHLYPAWDADFANIQERKPVSMTLDTVNVIKTLREYDYRLVLHGHNHKPQYHECVEDNPALRGNGTDRKLIISGAGSICVAAQHCQNLHQFQVIDLDRRRIRFHNLQTECGDSLPRPWKYASHETELGPVNDYQEANDATQRNRASDAEHARRHFEAYESWYDLVALRAADQRVTDRIRKQVLRAWAEVPYGTALDIEKADELFGRVLKDLREEDEDQVRSEMLDESQMMTAIQVVLRRMLEAYGG